MPGSPGRPAPGVKSPCKRLRGKGHGRREWSLEPHGHQPSAPRATRGCKSQGDFPGALGEHSHADAWAVGCWPPGCGGSHEWVVTTAMVQALGGVAVPRRPCRDGDPRKPRPGTEQVSRPRPSSRSQKSPHSGPACAGVLPREDQPSRYELCPPSTWLAGLRRG